MINPDIAINTWHQLNERVCMDFSKKIDLTALLVSFLALGISSWQWYESSQDNKMTNNPLIDISLFSATGGDRAHGFYIENAGNGAAIIEKMEIYVDAEPVGGAADQQWFTALDKVGWPSNSRSEIQLLYFPKDSLLKDGNERYLLQLNPSTGSSKREFSAEEYQLIKRIKIKIVYKNLFGDSCFTTYALSEEKVFDKSICGQT